jgi:hypothetical protein
MRTHTHTHAHTGELPSDTEQGLLARAFLLWTVPLLARGRDKTIEVETIPRLDGRFHAEESLKVHMRPRV